VFRGQALAVVACVVTGFWAVAAFGQRPATVRETAIIRAVAMRACGWPKYACKWNGARVSTIDPRYAYGQSVYEGFSGVLVRRVSVVPLRYAIVRKLGGGAEPCGSFPLSIRRVVKDLRLCFA
jgi:hypothetical protein